MPSAWNEYSVLAWWQTTLVDVGGNNPRVLAQLHLDSDIGFSPHADPVTPQRIVLPGHALWADETTTGTRTIDAVARLNSVSLGQEVELLAQQLTVQTLRTA